jgi:hypothetical protein
MRMQAVVELPGFVAAVRSAGLSEGELGESSTALPPRLRQAT